MLDTKDNNNPIIEDNSTYTLTEIYFIVRKHVYSIALISFSFLLISIFYTLTIKPTYNSSGSVMIAESDKSMSILEMGGLSTNRNYIQNEIQILKSRTVAELVVNKLFSYTTNFYAPYKVYLCRNEYQFQEAKNYL